MPGFPAQIAGIPINRGKARRYIMRRAGAARLPDRVGVNSRRALQRLQDMRRTSFAEIGLGRAATPRAGMPP